MTSQTNTTEEKAMETDIGRFMDNWKKLVRVSTTRYPVGQTPKETVWTLNKTRMYRYLPTAPVPKKHKTPLLLVFALMSRAYILDLRPGASFVEYMTNKGYDVYLLDYRFGEYTGLDVLRQATRHGCRAPMILLTGQGDHQTDIEAMHADLARTVSAGLGLSTGR